MTRESRVERVLAVSANAAGASIQTPAAPPQGVRRCNTMSFISGRGGWGQRKLC